MVIPCHIKYITKERKKKKTLELNDTFKTKPQQNNKQKKLNQKWLPGSEKSHTDSWYETDANKQNHKY